MKELLHQKFLRGLLVFALFMTVTVTLGAANFNPPTNGILYVKKGLTGDGSSWANALGEVAEALKIAKELNATTPGTVTQIWVAGGTYKPLYRADNMSGANPVDRNNAFVIVKDVKMYGGFAGNETVLTDRNLTLTTNASILSGDFNDNDIVTGSGGTLAFSNNTENAIHIVLSVSTGANPITNATVLDGFTIKGAYSNISSQTIIVNGADVIGLVGGGIYNQNSALIVANSIIETNYSVSNAGGVYNYISTPTFVNVSINRNMGGSTGAMYNVTSSPVLTNIKVKGNTYGIYNATSSSPVITNGLFTGQQIAIYNDDATCNPILTNVTMTENSTAMVNRNGTTPRIRNCIVYGNDLGILAVFGQTNNAIITNSLAQGVAANGSNIDGSLDPLFTNAAAGDYTLQPCSPAINAGSNSYYGTGLTPDLSAITTDLTGDARIQDTTIDMGAYEFEPLPMHLTLQSTALAIGQVCMNTDGAGSFVFSAVNMNNATLAVSALAGYSYSLTQNGVYTPTLTISNYNNEVTTIYVKFSPTAIQQYNGTINLAAQQNLSCVSQLIMQVTGEGINLPVTAITGATPTSITLTGAVLPGSSIEGGCSPISAYGIQYSTSATDVTGGLGTQVSATNINPAGNYSATVSGLTGCTTYYYRAYSTTLQGTVYGEVKSFMTIATPVAITAGSIVATGFTANWNAISIATEYFLDVSTSPTFGSSGVQTVTETLNNIASSSTFTPKSWIGDGGISWNANLAGIVLSSGNKVVRLRAVSATEAGVLISGVIPGGTSQIAFKYKAQASTSIGTLMVRVLTGSDFTAVAYSQTIPYTTTLTQFTTPVTGVTGDYKIEISVAGATKIVEISAMSFDAIVFTPSLVTGYNNLNVGNVTSYGVTGLTENIQYYYRVRANTGCISLNSNTIPVITQAACTTPEPVATAAQTVCNGSTVASLQVTLLTGAVKNWYTDATGGTALAETLVLATGNYYASQTVNGCEGPRVLVAVTVNPITAVPVAVAQTFCGPHTVADLQVTLFTGATKNWYADATGGTALAETTALATGNYYVSQTVNGCEGARIQVAVTVNAIPMAPGSIDQIFCGPHTVADLAVTLTTGAIKKWYATATSTDVLADNTSLASQSYFVSQTINGCESARTEITVVVNITPAVTAVDQTVCTGVLVSDLATTSGGVNIRWYTSATSTQALLPTDVVITGIYYVSQTINACESPRIAINVTTFTPDAPTAPAQTFCGTPTVADLDVTMGTAPLWYDDATGGEALAETVLLATGNYYVSQTVNGCESLRTEVAVTVNALPAAPIVSTQAFCGSATVGDLSVTTGTAPLWYNDATGGDALAETEALSTGTYYVSQTINGCESQRAEVIVTVNPVPAAPGAFNQIFCGTPTVANLEATIAFGAVKKWYATATSTEVLADNIALVSQSYYVSQTINGCESPREEITVTVNSTPIVTAVNQTLCTGATASDLTTTSGGINIRWYISSTAVDALLPTDAVTAGTYYVSQTINSCESARVAINVTLVTLTELEGDTTQEFTEGQTLANLVVTGVEVAAIVWYADETLTTVLPSTTLLTDGVTYYAVQQLGNCMSVAIGVTVSKILNTDSFAADKLTIYPNPVKDVITVSYNEIISSIEVYNSLGQLVFIKTLNAQEAKVDMSVLASGAYLVKVNSGDLSKNVRIIKQ